MLNRDQNSSEMTILWCVQKYTLVPAEYIQNRPRGPPLAPPLTAPRPRPLDDQNVPAFWADVAPLIAT